MIGSIGSLATICDTAWNRCWLLEVLFEYFSAGLYEVRRYGESGAGATLSSARPIRRIAEPEQYFLVRRISRGGMENCTESQDDTGILRLAMGLRQSATQNGVNLLAPIYPSRISNLRVRYAGGRIGLDARALQLDVNLTALSRGTLRTTLLLLLGPGSGTSNFMGNPDLVLSLRRFGLLRLAVPSDLDLKPGKKEFRYETVPKEIKTQRKLASTLKPEPPAIAA
eukprot:392802-Amorphochlora_amoeboformis.AAC.1